MAIGQYVVADDRKVCLCRLVIHSPHLDVEINIVQIIRLVYLLHVPAALSYYILSEKYNQSIEPNTKNGQITELELTTSLPLVISLMASLIFLSLLARP